MEMTHESITVAWVTLALMPQRANLRFFLSGFLLFPAPRLHFPVDVNAPSNGLAVHRCSVPCVVRASVTLCCNLCECGSVDGRAGSHGARKRRALEFLPVCGAGFRLCGLEQSIDDDDFTPGVRVRGSWV